MQGTTTGVSQREREMWRKHERAEKEGRAGKETEREEKKKELEPRKPIEMPKQAEKVSIKRQEIRKVQFSIPEYLVPRSSIGYMF